MLEPCWMMRDPEHVCANPLIFILVKWGSWCVEAHLTEGSEAEGQLSPWARCHWVEESAQVLLFGGPQHQWLPAVQFCFFKPYCLLELFYWRDKTLNLTYRICTPRITTKSIQFSKGGVCGFWNWLGNPGTPGNQSETTRSVNIPITTRKGLTNESEGYVCAEKQHRVLCLVTDHPTPRPYLWYPRSQAKLTEDAQRLLLHTLSIFGYRLPLSRKYSCVEDFLFAYLETKSS